MTVKTLIRVIEYLRVVYEACQWNLQRVRDEISELEERNKPVNISLKDKERKLSASVCDISATIDELLDTLKGEKTCEH